MEKGDQELKNADVPRRQEGIVLNYSRQGNGNPGLITAKNWILPMNWISLAEDSPVEEPIVKDVAHLYIYTLILAQ